MRESIDAALDHYLPQSKMQVAQCPNLQPPPWPPHFFTSAVRLTTALSSGEVEVEIKVEAPPVSSVGGRAGVPPIPREIYFP